MHSGWKGVALAAAVVSGIATPPCIAQTRVTSLEELRRALTAGDIVSVVPADGQRVRGRLTRLGTDDLDLRPIDGRLPGDRDRRDMTIAFDAIRSLERPRDPVRNGAAIGAGVGAAIGGALFGYATIIDRNEIDEWAATYVGVAAISTGIGTLIGWRIDAARSKPPIRFDARPKTRTIVSVRPGYSRHGVAVAVSVSR